MDVAAWLHGLGLGRYERAFRDNAVDGEVLPSLTAEDLKDLGVAAVGHRRKLLDAIAALRAGAEAGPAPPVGPAEPAGERRQVTVLFADLAGYTALSRELDAEEVHALLDRFFERVDRMVEEHGGRVDKHIGDCVMAVFGAPVAHGNDAERAVRAALAIRDAMPAVSAEVGPRGRRARRRRRRAGRRQRHGQRGPPRVHRHRRVGEPRLAPHRRRAAPARSWSRTRCGAPSPSGSTATSWTRSR